jgi:hypothetical protein
MGGGDYEPEESEAKLALAEQAAISLQRYGDVFVPLENQFIESSFRRFDDQAYDSAIGQAQTQAMGLYERAIQDQQSAAFGRGFDPTSGAFQGESEALRAAQARGVGLAGANAGIDNTDQAYAGLTGVVRMGQGLATDAMSGQIDLAQNALDRGNAQARQDFQNISSLRSLAGTGAGIASGYGLNNYGGGG